MTAAARPTTEPAWRRAARALPHPLTCRECEVVAAYLEHPSTEWAVESLGMDVRTLADHTARIAGKVKDPRVPERPGRMGHMMRIVWWALRADTSTAR